MQMRGGGFLKLYINFASKLKTEKNIFKLIFSKTFYNSVNIFFKFFNEIRQLYPWNVDARELDTICIRIILNTTLNKI